MKKLLLLSLVLAVGVVVGRMFEGVPKVVDAGPEVCVSREGDVNADGAVDLSDAVTILGYLFQGNPVELVRFCSPGGATINDTNQTTCYDAAGTEVECSDATCPGQDGAQGSGCSDAGRFVGNMDGTVTDSCTGLMWAAAIADLNGGGVDENDHAADWCAALQHVDGMTLASHTDWRLPNVAEAFDLIDFTVSDIPATPMLPASINYPSPVEAGNTAVFWTSSNLYWDPVNAWVISGRYATVSSVTKSFPFGYVLAVRDAN